MTKILAITIRGRRRQATTGHLAASIAAANRRTAVDLIPRQRHTGSASKEHPAATYNRAARHPAHHRVRVRSTPAVRPVHATASSRRGSRVGKWSTRTQ